MLVPSRLKRITCRHDEADHRLRAAKTLELFHHLRQRAFDEDVPSTIEVHP